MGEKGNRIPEAQTENKIIRIDEDIYDVSRVIKSVCKIETKYGNGSGFLLKFINENNEIFFCLMTNEHVITKKMIKNKEEIKISFDKTKKKPIILDDDIRFIKEFKDLDLDITIVEIIEDDKIDGEYFLLPDMNIEKEKNNLINQEILIVQFPNENLSYSKGVIKEIEKYELTYNPGTDKGSSGSPILLKSSQKIIGIHKQGHKFKQENYGDLLFPLFPIIFKNANFRPKSPKISLIGITPSPAPSSGRPVKVKAEVLISKLKNKFIFRKIYFYIPVIMLLLIIVFLCIWFGIPKTDKGKASKEREENYSDIFTTSSSYIVENTEVNIFQNIEGNIITQNTEKNNELNSIKITEKNIQIQTENIIIKNTIQNTEENIIINNTFEDIEETQKIKIQCNKGFYFSNNDNICKKCSIDNCDQCVYNNFKDICISCAPFFTPSYEKNLIKSCESNDLIDENKCYLFDIENKICLICHKGYKLINGKCFVNYSFKAIYHTKKANETIKLINNDYINYIEEIIIDDTKIIPKNNYTFSNIGNHTIYFLINNDNYNNSLAYMFYKLENIISISFTQYFDIKNILYMNNMFHGCSNLTYIDFSNLNMKNVIDMSHIFTQCKNLIFININNFDTKNVTNMSFMFNDCNKIKYINISNFNTKNVEDMKNMFCNCYELISINISNFNTEKVKNMSFMFNGCNNLKNIDISNFKTNNVENMKYMFCNCYELISIDISNFKTSKVEDMSYMFGGCNNLISLDISSFETNNVRDMKCMFCNNFILKSIDVSHFETNKVEDMSYMFGGCNNLIEINVSNFKTSLVKDMKYMFCNNFNLTSIDVSHFETNKVEDMSYMFHYCQKLINIDVSKFNTEKVKNMSYMFTGCNNLKHIDVSNFKTNNVQDMKYMFCNCFILTSIDVSNFNTENVIDMKYMFHACYDIVQLNIKNFKTNKVKFINSMFLHCKNLISIDLSNFNTENVLDMSFLFYNCKSISSIDASNFNTTNVYNMSEMFDNCINLKYLDISSFNGDLLINENLYKNFIVRNINSVLVLKINKIFYEKIKNEIKILDYKFLDLKLIE